MKNKQILYGIVALFILGTGVFLTRDDSEKTSSSKTSNDNSKNIIKSLDANKINSITITDSEKSASLSLTNGMWTVTDRDGYPADFDTIQSLVDKVSELKILAEQKVGKSQLGRFELNDPAEKDLEDTGTRLEFKDSDGNSIQSILFGKESKG